MNLCMVGYGTIAKAHTRAFRDEGVTLDTVVGRLPERGAAFASEQGYAHSTTNLAEALARSEIDLVAICSPSEAHAAQAEQALMADKHVLVEIPLAMTYTEGRLLAGLARERGKTLMVCHTHRYRSPMQEAKRRIARGELTLHNIVSRYVFFRRENRDLTGKARSWTDNLLWHHGNHATDLCLWLLGVTDVAGLSVTSQIALPDQKMSSFLDLTLLVRTPLDQLVSVNMSYNSHVSLCDYLLIGREESLVLPGQGPDTVNGVAAQDHDFLAAVRDGSEPAISAESVLPALWVLQQAQDQYNTFLQHRPGAAHPIAP
ncbi:MAG: Gfo/Idh/MocA family oxidoreductase [Chloroflexota bacterium]|nr:Gfo/Idh/MocA family oxidoreductase [Chloroflexota bacterium]